jgi:hypothetical protein
MTAAAQLGQALAGFLRAYETRPELVEEQRGWSPVIALEASDAPARIAVALHDGRVARVEVDASAAATLRITAELRTLCDVLELRRDPNEPYLFGELVVVGPEADFLRLDYIASRLCPR